MQPEGEKWRKLYLRAQEVFGEDAPRMIAAIARSSISGKEPDFSHPPHGLPSMYAESLLLLCNLCGYWEVVQDVWETHPGGGGHWRSETTLPCICQVCEHGTLDAVDDDAGLMIRPEPEETYEE